jgi:hypothetical protein
MEGSEETLPIPKVKNDKMINDKFPILPFRFPIGYPAILVPGWDESRDAVERL